jgi:hypothetical protein
MRDAIFWVSVVATLGLIAYAILDVVRTRQFSRSDATALLGIPLAVALALISYGGSSGTANSSDSTRFVGRVGHLAVGKAFLDFVRANEGRDVSLNVTLPLGDSDVHPSPPGSTLPAWFFVAEDCYVEVTPGEPIEPSNCKGYRLVIENASQLEVEPFRVDSSGYRLVGDFRIKLIGRDEDGPYPFSTAVALRGLNVGD